jgi:hypothetical protein
MNAGQEAAARRTSGSFCCAGSIAFAAGGPAVHGPKTLQNPQGFSCFDRPKSAPIARAAGAPAPGRKGGLGGGPSQPVYCPMDPIEFSGVTFRLLTSCGELDKTSPRTSAGPVGRDGPLDANRACAARRPSRSGDAR